MERSWDAPTNTEPLTAEERVEQEFMQRHEARLRAQATAGYMEIPFLSDEQLLAHFNAFRQEVDPWRMDNGMAYRYRANKIIWICHNCGVDGYKYTIRETFRCYCCRSRNVTVCRAGEVSMVIRGNSTIPVGVNMQEIYRLRRERIEANRRRR